MKNNHNTMKRFFLLFSLVILWSATNAQTFSEHFTDNTLRIDYTFVGNATNQLIALDEDAWKDEEYKDAVVEEALRDMGFVIEPKYLFRKMVKMVENRAFDIEFLQQAINALMESTIGNESQEDFDGLFSDMQLDSTKLGHTVKDRSAVMSKIIAALDEINFSMEDTKIDVLGNAYEYLIGQFAATAGKKAGEFYTPSGPAELLCRLACLGLTDVKAAADPTCGSGSLLLRLKKYANIYNYYGQELTSTTYNLARMNMILRGIPYRRFNIYNGDTLEHDYFEDTKFRVQVANPPYSANWSADMKFMEDERFNEYGKLAPKSKADFAFVQHMVHHMDEDGRAVVLLPHGVLCELAQAPDNIFAMFNNADIRFPEVKDGEGKKYTLTHGTYQSYLQNKDRVLRENAFKGLYSVYEQFQNTLAAIYYANLKQADFFAKERRYASAMEEALDASSIPVQVYKNLVQTINDTLPVMHRYVALRKKLLNLPELHMYDVYVPMVECPDKNYSFEEAKDMVLRGLAPLGEEYLALLREGFENRWIDVYENEGKRTGAYSWGAYGTHPYVLLNFNGTLNDVFTLEPRQTLPAS